MIQDIFTLLNELVKLGKITPAVCHQQKQLINHGFNGINPVIRQHYSIDNIKNCYIIK